MFFRPEGLTAEAHLAPEELQWQLARHGGKTELKLRNPSKFHVSMGDVKLGTTVVIDSTMIAPGEERTFSVPDLPSAKTVDLTFSSINDYGAQVPYSVTLSVGSPAGATAKRSS
ncbi:putative fimbrial chaperone YadV [compost metagenome]